MKMRTYFCCFVLALGATSLVIAGDEEDRLIECGRVTKEILGAPDGIPQALLDKAECIIVLPSVKKGAFGFGGAYGKGAMICRQGEKFDGTWGAPAMFRMEEFSFGFQLGGSATDFLMLVMNPRGANSLLRNKVKLGAEATAAAGPKGRSTKASTDAAMTAEILTYSRAKGLIAGISLDGSTLRQDSGDNEDIYGRKIDAREIVIDGAVSAPAAANSWIELLNTRSPKNLSDNN